MNIRPFAVEEWMNEYEDGARYNIAETCVDSVSLDKLFALTQTIDVYIYKALLENPNINLSSAASLLQSVFGCITIVVANKVVKKIDPNAGLF